MQSDLQPLTARERQRGKGTVAVPLGARREQSNGESLSTQMSCGSWKVSQRKQPPHSASSVSPSLLAKDLLKACQQGGLGLCIGVIVPVQMKNRIREEGDLLTLFWGWDPMKSRRGENISLSCYCTGLNFAL